MRRRDDPGTEEARWRVLLWDEWRRRKARCAADLEEARKSGDLTTYRTLLARWRRYYSRPDRGRPQPRDGDARFARILKGIFARNPPTAPHLARISRSILMRGDIGSGRLRSYRPAG